MARKNSLTKLMGCPFCQSDNISRCMQRHSGTKEKRSYILWFCGSCKRTFARRQQILEKYKEGQPVYTITSPSNPMIRKGVIEKWYQDVDAIKVRDVLDQTRFAWYRQKHLFPSFAQAKATLISKLQKIQHQYITKITQIQNQITKIHKLKEG